MSGRAAGRRFDAEEGVTTEALLFLGELDPEAIGASLNDATHYQPVPIAEFEALLRAAPLPFGDATFVDLGSGMGRAVLLAARHPFRTIVGVEISPALHAVARDNLARVDRSSWRCRDVRLVCRDALDYRWPPGDLVVFLFNPFRAGVFGSVVRGLEARRAAGRVVVLYHTPLERALFDTSGSFEVVAELGYAVVYRLIAPSDRRRSRTRRPSRSVTRRTPDTE